LLVDIVSLATFVETSNNLLVTISSFHCMISLTNKPINQIFNGIVLSRNSSRGVNRAD
jgi:hypothetical protein